MENIVVSFPAIIARMADDTFRLTKTIIWDMSATTGIANIDIRGNSFIVVK